AVPSGSYLAISHGTNVIHGDASDEVVRRWNEDGKEPIVLRNPQEINRFFDRLELVEPGVVSTTLWRPDPASLGANREVDEFCAVGRKP
ncbi:MAG: SAM-dependent methyltransferase, partial [Pseudonocardiaceae bacterium]